MIRLFVVAGLLLGAVFPAFAADKIVVFAAASMKDVIDTAAEQFKAANGAEVTASYASSSVLAKQIEAGAPAAIFISADLDWMDYVQERKLINTDSRAVIAGNALVIAGAKDAKPAEALDILKSGRFSMGDPSNVPAGKYGKAAMEKLGIWGDVSGNAVFAENVRVALQYVSRGEVNAGIVYASDRAQVPELTEVYRFPASSHAPILYPAALIGDADGDAKAFLEFLRSDAGQAIIADKGFVPAAEAK
ncbi:molybdate ABC transporter substrate-binding protein [Pseudochrobactrum sp. MP213Fo]|uniref:molybdate ABC transporter substrate-binding protein n=1 Tax=Pseudochrobactrum sp. MP213Fo TaxID=3022250 RepID=UPI003B9E84F0